MEDNKMAVIKCKNCENEILDTEIVCPYCDSPVASDIPQKDTETKGATDETVKIATSKDFEKEKESFLKSILEESRQGFEDTDTVDSADSSQETVKIPTREITYRPAGNARTTGQRRQGGARASYYQRKEKKKKRQRMTIAIISAIVAVAGLIWLISSLIGGGGKNTADVASQSDISGYIYSEDSKMLTITDGSVFNKEYTSTSEKPWDSVGEVKYLEISSGITKISSYAFSGMNIEKVNLPKSLTEIGTGAFYNCSKLSDINFNGEVSTLTIHSRAFARCTSLKSVDLPEGVAKVDAHAFIECTALETVTVNGKNTKIEASAFDGCDSIKTVWCYEDSDAEKVIAYGNDDISVEYLGNKSKDDDNKDEKDDESEDESEKDEDEEDSENDDSDTDKSEDDDKDKKDNSEKDDSDKKDTEKKDSDKKDSVKKDTDKNNNDSEAKDESENNAETTDKQPDSGKTNEPTTDGGNGQGETDTDIAPDAYEDFNGGNFESQEAEDDFYSQFDV